MSYTYAVMEVSEKAYEEIHAKLKEAGYQHAITPDNEFGIVLDMHGIALAKEKKT